MADVLRSCAKTGCRWPAAASLSYRYATRQVWLLDLAPAPDPSLYDLCPHHADHLVVPNGWEQVDDRSVHEVMVEPSAFDRAEEAARRRMAAVEPPPRQTVIARSQQLVGAGAGAGRNRYAALVEQLPKLAAEQQAHPAEDAAVAAPPPGQGSTPTPDPSLGETPAGHETVAVPAAAAPPPGPLADRGRTGPTTGAGRPPLPAHELAPAAVDHMSPPPSPAPARPAGEEPLPGQLAIPVDDLTDDATGVVLQFDLAGARRRGKSS